MDFKRLLKVSGFVLIAMAFWLWWWCQPERQVRRAQGRLFAALESKDFDGFAAMLAEDYRDRWEHDKANVLRRSREVIGQFALLDFNRTEQTADNPAGAWVVGEKVRISGLGGYLAMAARDRVNALNAPFSMTWRKRGWKPWDWELVRVEQAELEIPGGW